MALAAFLVTVAVVAIGGRTSASAQTAAPMVFPPLEDASDLPCPWCRAQTAESDDHCRSCGQKFG